MRNSKMRWNATWGWTASPGGATNGSSFFYQVIPLSPELRMEALARTRELSTTFTRVSNSA